jgi:hypothetical protein
VHHSFTSKPIIRWEQEERRSVASFIVCVLPFGLVIGYALDRDARTIGRLIVGAVGCDREEISLIIVVIIYKRR